MTRFTNTRDVRTIPAPRAARGERFISPRQAILRKTNWALAVAALLLPALPAGAATLKQIATVDLPGPPGKRFDYLTINYDKNYLLSAHLAAGLLYVIDLKTNRLVKAIPGVPGVEGVEYAPGLNKVYTSDSGDNKIGVVDLNQSKVVKTLPTEAKPDGQCLRRALS